LELINSLDQPTLKVAKDCLRAAIEGPFFQDWEFQTLVGVDRAMVKVVYDAWPEQTVGQDDFASAVIGTMNNLLGYPHGRSDAWTEYISASPAQVREALDKIISLGL
jgi:hypothetical protein